VIREPVASLLSAMTRDRGGIAVVWCPDLGLRDWLVTEVESLAPPDAQPLRATELNEIEKAPHRMGLLVPKNERETVLDLDGNRDRIAGDDSGRTQPVVLFLLRDGDGAKALTEAVSLSSWIRGSDPDPEALAEVDVEAERNEFVQSTGHTPEDWLTRWRAGTTSQNAVNHSIAYRAMLLERR